MDQQRPPFTEGYWRRTVDESANLPWLEADAEWPEREAFLQKLSIIEAEAYVMVFRGLSPCRLCGELNGCREFWLWPYAWPEGLRHYIEQHGVRPSVEFEGFVLRKAGQCATD